MTGPKSIITAEDSAHFSAWQMPEVKEGQVVHTEKMQKRGPRGELVNVDKNEVVYSSMTAGQLEDIANQAYEEVHERAYAEGHQQGHTDGYAEGIKAAQQTITEQVTALHSVVEQLHSYLGGQDDEVEQALINLVSCVAKAVIQCELNIESSHIQKIVAQALAVLPMNPENVQIFLSEQDHQLLQTHASLSDQYTVQADSSVTPGGCRITTDHSIVDYTLEEQFQQTVNTLVGEQFALLQSQVKNTAEHEKTVDQSSADPSQLDADS